MLRILVPFIASMMVASAVSAGPVSFSDWKHQRLSLFSSNKYSFGNSLGVKSDGAVSIAWTRLGQADWNRTGASWSWSVDTSVPPTDLGKKGGDDRNLSLYFVFLPADEAERLAGASIRKLLGNKNVRILQYAWGGNHGRGAFIASPYAPSGQGFTVALRQAGTGVFSESRNLAADYQKAFGGTYGKLVGLAVSGDSDDTSTEIDARISNLNLK